MMTAIDESVANYYRNLGYDEDRAVSLANADVEKARQAASQVADNQAAFQSSITSKIESIQSASVQSVAELTQKVNDALSSSNSYVQNAVALGAYHEGLQSPNTVPDAAPGGNNFTPGSVAAAKSSAPYWLLAGLVLFFLVFKKSIKL